MATEKSIESSTAISEFFFNAFLKFVDELRSSGYNIGIEQYIAIQDILVALALQGQFPNNPQNYHELRTWIAPIICTSPEEQNLFYVRFDQWIEQYRISLIAPTSDRNSKSKKGAFIRKSLSIFFSIVSLLVVIGIISFLALFRQDLLPQPIPSPNNPSSFPEWIITSIGIMISVFFFFFLSWGLWKFSRKLWAILRRQIVLKKRSESQLSEIIRLLVKNEKRLVFQGSIFRKIAQKLGQYREVKLNDIDISATITETMQNAGWFTPAYSSRKLLPEYLALVEHTSFSDHHARRVDEILGHLQKNGIFVDRYYFDKDPRDCWTEEPTSPHLKIPDLKSRYPNHRLLIFCDPTNLINPLTGHPHRWLDRFMAWDERALLIPKPKAEWRYQEQRLSDVGFLLFPTTEVGLSNLSETFQAGIVSDSPNISWKPRYPEILKEQVYLGANSEVPSNEFIERLCSQIRYYLGSEAYYWFSACAIYPLLNWEITLYLGTHLFDKHRQQLLSEERLLSLTRLPWFRDGKMPDWLRLKLISELSVTQEKAIRVVLEELLLSALNKSREGFYLEFASKEIDLHNRKKILHRALEAEPQWSPLRDYVFIEFISHKKPPKLGFPLPKSLHFLFFEYFQSKQSFQVRTAPILLFLLSFLSISFAGGLMELGMPSWSLSFFLRGLPFAVAILLVVGSHAFGHYVTAHLEGIYAFPPYFVPTFSLYGTLGAYTKMQWPILKRQSLLRIFTIGPIVGFCMSLLMVIVGLTMSEVKPLSELSGGISLGSSLIFSIASRAILGKLSDTTDIILHPVAFAGWFGLIYNCWHLYPIGKLDGGRIVYGLWGSRVTKWVSFISIGILIVIGFWANNWFAQVFTFVYMIKFRQQYASDKYTEPLDRSTIWLLIAVLLILILSFTPVPATMNFN